MEQRVREVDSANRLKAQVQPLLRDGSPQALSQAQALTDAPQRAERMAAYTQQLRNQVRDKVFGGFSGDAQATPSPSPKKKKNLFDRATGAAGDILGGAGDAAGSILDEGKDLGGEGLHQFNTKAFTPAMKTLDAPRKYVGAPAFGILSGLNKSETYTDPKTGRQYKKSASLKDVGESLAEAVQHPIRAYEKGGESTELYKADPNKNFVHRALTDVASDPLSYVGAGLASKAVKGVGLSGKLATVATELLDSGGPGVVIGANVAATGEQEYGQKVPGWNKLSPEVRSLIAGVAGGVGGGKVATETLGKGRVGLQTEDVGGPQGAKPELSILGEGKTGRNVMFDWEFPAGVKMGDQIDTPFGRMDVQMVQHGKDSIPSIQGRLLKTNSKDGVSKTDRIFIRRGVPDPELLAANKVKTAAHNVAVKDPANVKLLEGNWEPSVTDGEVTGWRHMNTTIERGPDGSWTLTRSDGPTFQGLSAPDALDKALAYSKAEQDYRIGKGPAPEPAPINDNLRQNATDTPEPPPDAGTTDVPPPGEPPVTGDLTPSPEPARSPLSLIDLPEITPVPLSKMDTWMNTVRGMFNMPEKDTIASPAFQQRQAMKNVAGSQAARLSTISDALVHNAFEIDKKGRIASLPGMPSVQDVAARMQTYGPLLTPEQATTMQALREMTAPYRELLHEVGADEHLGHRTDIDPEGFYLPRGDAAKAGADAPLKSSRGRGRKGFEKSAEFESMMKALDSGYEYSPFADAMRSYATDAAGNAIDQHIANYLTSVTDEGGVRVGQTPVDRMPMALREEYEGAKRAVASLSGRLDTATKRAGVTKTGDELAKMLESQMTGATNRASAGAESAGEMGARMDAMRAKQPPPPRSIEAATNEVTTLHQVVNRAQKRIYELRQRGGKYADQAKALQDSLDEAQLRLDAVTPKYKKALEDARQTPREQGAIQMGQLQGWTFPDLVANAANRYLEKESPLFGRGAQVQRAIVATNNLLRGLKASLDVSFIGIQGLLGVTRDPVGYGTAMKVAYQSMADPQALGKFLQDFDAEATKAGRPTSADWARVGGHIGGADTEFSIGQGLPGKVQALSKGDVPKVGLNPIRGSNRMFGYFGDTFRLKLMDTMYQTWAGKGLDMTTENLQKIADSGNRATGWSPNTFAGEVGQLAQFAPRFFQSQLEAIVKAVSDGSIEGAEARRMLLGMVGTATVLTVAANEAGGRPISYKEMFDPESPNFLRFRLPTGNDVSLLGPWDSLAKGIVRSVSPVSPKGVVKAATGGGAEDVLRMPEPSYLLRSKASPVVGMAWDLLSGKTFTGEDASLKNPAYFVRSLLPFSVADISANDLTLSGATNRLIGLGGIKASVLSPTDQLNTVSRAKFGADFYDLEPSQKEQIKQEHPDLWQRSVEHGSSQKQKAEAVRAELLSQQQASDQQLLSGKLTREEWISQMQARRDEQRYRFKEIYGDSAPSDKTPRDRYFNAIDQSTDPTTGAVDWGKVDTWLASQPKADQDYIARNLGVSGTPLEKLYRSVTSEYYNLPRYRGFTADEAKQIDDLAQEARNYQRGDSMTAKLAALRKVSQGIDPKIVSGARRKMLGYLAETADRKRWKLAHPEGAIALGRGSLTPDDVKAIQRKAA